MSGLWCKGLHCAGCGRGIPASVLVLFLAIAMSGKIGHILGELSGTVITALEIIAGEMAVGAALTALIVGRMYYSHRRPLVGGRWDDMPTACEAKALEDGPVWPSNVVLGQREWMHDVR